MATDDMDLLREYARHQSEEAFAALVSRHINLVYTVALRRLHDAHLAEEVTQAAFIILSRKAGSLNSKTILSAWLCRTAQYAAGDACKMQRRRQRREQEVYMRSLLNSSEADNSPWSDIASMLDDAMAGLGEKDHSAIVLRFFEGKDLKEVGAALGLSENTAKTRVSRAVEKLRQYFFKHGAAFSAASITAALSAHAIHGAPSGLAGTVAAAALKGSTASSSTATLIKSTLKLMAWTKAKTAVVAGVVLLLAGGAANLTIEKMESRSSYPWRVAGFDGGVLMRAPPMLAILPSKVPYGAWGNMGTKMGTKLMGTGVSAQEVVETAYGDKGSWLQTVVTTGLPKGTYDYIASLPGDNAARLRAEVKRKFGLVATLETRETNVLVLILKNEDAPGLRPGAGQNSSMGGDSTGEHCVNQPLSSLAWLLSNRFGVPVVDKTEKPGRFDFDLKWEGQDRDQPPTDALKQYLLEQLGMELAPEVQQIPMLVIAKAD